MEPTESICCQECYAKKTSQIIKRGECRGVYKTWNAYSPHPYLYSSTLENIFPLWCRGRKFPSLYLFVSYNSPLFFSYFPNYRYNVEGEITPYGRTIGVKTIGWLADQFGWESVFYVFGVLGIVWFVAWCILITDDPTNHPTISREEKEFISKSIGQSTHFKARKV